VASVEEHGKHGPLEATTVQDAGVIPTRLAKACCDGLEALALPERNPAGRLIQMSACRA
jgi:hypothetical protein